MCRGQTPPAFTPSQNVVVVGGYGYLRVRAERDPGVCLQMLIALKAAIQGVRTTMLDPASKAKLRDWMRNLDQPTP
jgi:hypothetical protein